jgi:FAD synthetase
MFRPIEEINPAVITIGFNQYFDEAKLRGQLQERGLNADVIRIRKYGDGDLASSRLIVQRIVEKRGGNQSGPG